LVMHNRPENDTITAIATPPGLGAIACIRVSGPEAFKAVNGLLPEGDRIEKIPPRYVWLSWLVSRPGKQLDQVTLVRYAKPHSYTGEDLVEIFCHGGRLVPGLIVERLVARGCRVAEPGEFTRRAVLNSKLDLVQAESIADIVAAESPAQLGNALLNLEGAFSRKVNGLRRKLLDACTMLELGLDFSEEDVEFADRQQIGNLLDEIGRTLENLLAGFERGQALKEGWRVAIIGKPNVGKSSLMNALLKHDRVIVSSIPGTTRDTVEDRIHLGGHLFRIIDTAGIRNESDEIEQFGIERSQRAAQEADIVLFVSDNSVDADSCDEKIATECLPNGWSKKQPAVIHVCNKTDLPASHRPFRFENGHIRTVATSALSGDGISELEKAIVEMVSPGKTPPGHEIFYINVRQRACLQQALAALQSAKRSLDENLSAEFIAADIRHTAEAMGALVGEIATEEILEEIFANFCIGK